MPIDIKGTLLLVAVILALLIVLTRGCSSRVDKFREYRDQRRSERHDRIDQWREHRGENRRWRWGDRRRGYQLVGDQQSSSETQSTGESNEQ